MLLGVVAATLLLVAGAGAGAGAGVDELVSTGATDSAGVEVSAGEGVSTGAGVSAAEVCCSVVSGASGVAEEVSTGAGAGGCEVTTTVKVLVLVDDSVVTASGVGVGVDVGVEVVPGRGITDWLASYLDIPLTGECKHTGRLGVVGDDLSGATAGVVVATLSISRGGFTTGLESTALVQSLVSVTTHMSAIRNGSAGDGSRGGQKSSPHDN